ncbi:hypothetical protein [Chryseobacterium fistulae]|uniref:Uncharacterized protein n=3 Tax=Chryseobacterium TaxID=59732 RepID=A0A6N4X4X7_9FLAO|nr:hypothetical protein [Chryseobacterium fistulae]CAA7194531.1 hypothetical protein CHRY9293_00843 [Chryseobacterium potabilaquae]CAA7387229.1 hypothetical protein CHRY9393_01537 [Chryseobacterium fistulae]
MDELIIHQFSFIYMKKRHEQKLIILSIGLMIMFSIPISLLFNSEDKVLGYPMMLVYIFIIWIASIIISFVIVKKYDE